MLGLIVVREGGGVLFYYNFSLFCWNTGFHMVPVNVMGKGVFRGKDNRYISFRCEHRIFSLNLKRAQAVKKWPPDLLRGRQCSYRKLTLG